MSLPQFTAEASLGPASTFYRGAAGSGGASAGDVVPSQFGRITWPLIRCCRWAPLFRRFVCTSRRRAPWENCRCIATQSGPVILCEDIVLTQQRGD
ncbi:MAG: hypothetical protein ACRD1U_11955 [Vicinamibacterales bacterium]